MTATLAFLASPLGRGLAIAAVLAGSFGWWLRNHDQRVEERVVTNINKSAENLSEKAVENRARGDVPDALAKLRKKSCRDCDG